MSVTGSYTYTDECETTSGTLTSGSPIINAANAGNSIRNSFPNGDVDDYYWYFTLSGNDIQYLSNFQIYFQYRRSLAGETYTSTNVSYSIDGGNYEGAQPLTTYGAANAWVSLNYDYSAISDANTSITFRIQWQQTGNGACNVDIDNFQIQADYNFVLEPGVTNVTVPACVEGVNVKAWGAGAGGTNRNGAAGGGGGGAFTAGTISGLVPGNVLNVTVGTGGTVGQPRTAPGNYSSVTFGSAYIQANGGLSLGNSRNGGAGGAAQTVGGIITAAWAGGNGGNARNNSNGDDNEAGGGGGGSAFQTSNGNPGANGGNSTWNPTAGGTGSGNGGDGASADGWPNATAGNLPGGGGGGRGEGGGQSQTGADGAVELEWIYATAPIISIQPNAATQAYCLNEAANALSATATAGSGSITGYQWYSNTSSSNLDGTLISGATASSFTPPTSTAGTLYYYVIITNSYGCTSTSEVSGAVEVTAATPAAATNPNPANTASNICYAGNVAPLTELTWSAVAGATSYNIYFGAGSLPGSVTANVGTNSYSVGTLAANTTYYWRAVPVNGCGEASGAATWTFTTAASPCFSYCDAGNTGYNTRYIDGVTIGDITTTSTGWSTNGYGDYTGSSTSLIQGETNVSISINFVDGGYGYDIGIWIDWNQDGDFDDPSENVICGENASSPQNYTFDVPSGATLGTTRMRIRLSYNNNDCGSSCGILNNTRGEVEDYTIIVQPAVSITTHPLSVHSYCPGSSITVPYSTSGSFNSGNVFSVQLSDENGSFSSPATLTSTATGSGTITADLPLSAINGTAYRVRVVSSDPYFEGSNNGTDITIGSPDIITSPGSQCKYGDEVTVTVSASSAQLGTFEWFNSAYEPIQQENGYSSTLQVNIASNQTYYVRLTAGGCSTPYTPVTAYAIIPPELSASVGGSFCVDDPILLDSEGSYDNIYWEGPDFYSTDQDPVIYNSTTTMSGTYTVYTNRLSGVNLVYNGNFELGNIGFTSSYGYVPPTNNALWPEGLYTIVNDPGSVHDNFYSCPPASGNLQMVVNGNTSNTDTITWSQTVNVVENTDYQFSYYVQSVELGSPSRLQLYINGTEAGEIYEAEYDACQSKQFIYNWNSGGYDEAELVLVNKNRSGAGNDFALDSIVFQHTCTAEASVEVYVSDGFTPEVSITASPSNEICEGELVTFTAHPLHGGSDPDYRWFNDGVLIPGENGSTFSTSGLNDGEKITCEMTSSLTGCLPGSATDLSDEITMIVHPLPSISTDGTIAAVRSRTISQTTTLSYTASTNTPTSYSINWDATANLAGLTDQAATAFAFSASGGTITGIEIPANVPDNINPYQGTLTIYTANGCEASQAVTILIEPASIFDSHPADLTICANEGGNLTVSATAASPNYQWQVLIGTNWTDITPALLPTADISGETSATLLLDDMDDYAGTYQVRCEVTDGAYTENSNTATVTIHPVPLITTGGVATAICYNTLTTSLSYSAASGTPTSYSIDWNTGPADQGVTAFTFNPGGGIINTISVSPATPPGTYQGSMTLYNANGCESTVNIALTIMQFNLLLSPNGASDCPQLSATTQPAFNPENTSYHHGATEVIFKVAPDAGSDYQNGWSFDFDLTGTVIATMNPSNVTVLTLEGDDATAPSRTGTLLSGSINAGNNSYVDLLFQVENTPGSEQLIEISIDNTNNGYGCSETSTANDNEADYTIEAMPEVGAFN
ncbi:GEVED domain-containing protein [Roseimarinus sediminis]|uniref:GEVED domain-containing protein n=1 Tax=Roseimarinus sediminis TaxID=1610899 RepID=UPI003D1BD4C2